MTALGLASVGWLLVLSWLIPNHYFPWLSAYSEVAAAASALVLGITVSIVRSSMFAPPAAAFFVALAAVPLVQVASHQIAFFGDAWLVTMYLLCAAASVTWSARAARLDAQRWSTCLAAALLASALLSCIILTIQRLAGDAGPVMLFIVSVAPGRAPFGNLGQPNQLATLLAAGLAALLFFYERGKASATYAIVAAAALTLALVVTQSRTAMLFWIVAIAWHWQFARRVELRVPRRMIVALTLGWMVLYPIWPTLVTTMGFENQATAASRLLRLGPRDLLWPQMAEAIALHPWVGYGWNQVSFAQMAVATQHRGLVFTESAHNLVLDLAVWNGVPLAALISILAVGWLVKAATRVRTLPAVFALLLIFLFLAHAMVEFPLAYLYFIVPFSLAIGIVSNEVAPDAGWRVALVPRIAVPIVFGSVATLAAVDYMRVEENYRDMRFAVAHFGKGMPVEAPPFLKTEFTQLAAFHHFSLTTPSGPLDGASLRWMRDVAYRYPYAPSLYRYALAQALSSDIPGAETTLLALRNMYGDGPYGEARGELISMSEKQPILRRLRLPETGSASSVEGAPAPGR